MAAGFHSLGNNHVCPCSLCLASFGDSRNVREPDDSPLFGDLANPKTAQLVDPNDLSSSFGPGVKLVETTIAITEEQVARGIERTLRWITGLQGSIGKDDHLPYEHFLNQLNDGSFRQGMKR
jgi:hypothetical protein